MCSGVLVQLVDFIWDFNGHYFSGIVPSGYRLKYLGGIFEKQKFFISYSTVGK
jgi:hypothetical protein